MLILGLNMFHADASAAIKMEKFFLRWPKNG